MGPHLPGLTMAAQKSWKNMGMLAGVANCGRSRKWGRRGRLVLGFKPRCGSHDKHHHAALGLPLPLSLGSRKAGCSSDTELSLSSLEECRGDTEGMKGVKELLLLGHEKVKWGFRLRTGDAGDTADGAGNQGRPASRAWITGKNRGLPEPQTSISCPETWYPGLGKGGKEGLCVFVGVLRDFGILMKTLSHYS